jgi:hypothetical protein
MRIALLCCLLLAACANGKIPPTPQPVALGCADVCYTPCDTTVPLWAPPDAAKPDAWSFIRPQVVDPLAAKLSACEIHRKECQSCIDAAAERGVITR